MTSITDIRRRARRDLHNALRVPALFIDGMSTPVLVHVRLHVKEDIFSRWVGRVGVELAGTEEIQPKILFMRDEITDAALEIKRNVVISVYPGEAYRLDRALPFDDITVSWMAVRLTAREATGLPVPSDTDA
jgi:hypothetical protein